MLKINILTIFPELFESLKEHSIIKIALNKKLVEIELINFRDFSKNKHKKVDDTPYGGGSGMLLTCQPIVDALKSITNNSHICMLSADGNIWNQNKVKEFIKSYNEITFICGHYEGIDSRVENYINEKISLGKFITTGGETALIPILDSLVRSIDGVITEDSLKGDTYYKDTSYIKHPQYTKPAIFDGHKVPEVLTNGNHQKIQEWKDNHSKKNK